MTEFENENGELSPVFLVAQKNQDPATSAFKRLGKQDQEFEVSPGYTARPFLIKQKHQGGKDANQWQSTCLTE